MLRYLAGYINVKVVFSIFLFSLLPAFQLVIAQKQNSGPTFGRFVVNDIHLEGNTVTKPYIIYRELLFKKGDTLSEAQSSELFEKSRQNLLNTSLFNFVTVTEERDANKSDIRIKVVERWYIWPTPIFELTDRNFNSWWVSRDFTRINYGVRVKWGNFRGRMEDLDLMLRFGKNHYYGLFYHIPYIDKNKRIGAGLETGFIRMRETGFVTQHDKLDFLFNEKYLIHQRFAAIHFSYRRSIHTVYLVEFRYQKVNFSDSLLQANPDYSYSKLNTADYFGLYYKMKVDYRDAKYYPLTGWYTDIELNKSGLGFGFEKPVNVLWMKSTSRFFLPLAKRWYLGTSLVGKISSGAHQPYFLMQGLGYERDFVRGYEYYVIDGQHYALTRNNIKFALLPERIAHISFIPTPKFSRIHYAAYLNLLLDAGYVWNNQINPEHGNVLAETLLFGTGVGLDFVTYYDKVIRIEYSLNKSGESGIFIHLIAGI